MLTEKIVFRDFRPKDADDFCHVLGESFKAEYGEQGVNISKYKLIFRLLGFFNIFLRPMHMDFFKIYVAVKQQKVIGCIGAYRVIRKSWYLGFAAVSQEYRRQDVFSSLLIPFFGKLLKTSAKMLDMEIHAQNLPTIKIATRLLNGYIKDTNKIFIFNSRFQSTSFKGKGQFNKAGSHEKINDQYSVQDLVPVYHDCINRGFISCLARWILPPTIFKSYVYKFGGRTLLFFRCRIQYPGRFWSIDSLWYDSMMNQKELKRTLEELFNFLHSKTKKPIKIYTDNEDQKLCLLLEEWGLPFFLNMCFIVIDFDDLPKKLRQLREKNDIII